MQTKKPGAPTRTIAFRLSAEDYIAFERIIDKIGESKSSYLRMLILRLNEKLIDDLEND